MAQSRPGRSPHGEVYGARCAFGVGPGSGVEATLKLKSMERDLRMTPRRPICNLIILNQDMVLARQWQDNGVTFVLSARHGHIYVQSPGKKVTPLFPCDVADNHSRIMVVDRPAGRSVLEALHP